MRIAGHTLGTPEHSIPEALALFVAAGLDAAEVIYQDGYRSGLPLRDRRAAEQARRASEDLGIPIVGMTPYTTAINALDEREWRTGVDEFRGAIEIAQIVGRRPAPRLRRLLAAGPACPRGPLEAAGRGAGHAGAGSLRRRDTALRREPLRNHDPIRGADGATGA